MPVKRVKPKFYSPAAKIKIDCLEAQDFRFVKKKDLRQGGPLLQFPIDVLGSCLVVVVVVAVSAAADVISYF